MTVRPLLLYYKPIEQRIHAEVLAFDQIFSDINFLVGLFAALIVIGIEFSSFGIAVVTSLDNTRIAQETTFVVVGVP